MTEDMGVTGNAILLLGYVAGAIAKSGREDRVYQVESAEPAAGTQIVRHVGTKNTYRISIVQLTGTE